MNTIQLFAAATKIGTGAGTNSVPLPRITTAQFLTNALNLTYFAAGVVAVIVIIIAGYTFATGVYDPAKITQAKNQLLYSIVGLICVIFAFVITQFIMAKF
jgi:hypothetical protein